MSLVYFTDRDLGLRFPEILSNAGLTVNRHRDYFSHDATDEEWLAEVGSRLLVVIGHAPYPDLARSFVATLSRIEAFLEEHAPPLIAKVYRAIPSGEALDPPLPGRIELWYPS